MEYRLKYRDIPWHVALIVLPGKILGTVFIKWPVSIAKNWEHCMVLIGVVLTIIAIVVGLAYFLSDGEVHLIRLALMYLGVMSP